MITGVVAPSVAVARGPRTRSTDAAIARHALRRVVIGGVVCALVFGGTIASSAVSYVSTFPAGPDRAAVAAAMSGDSGLAVLLGPIAAVDTVGGYTTYKCFVFLTTIGAIWALLAATKLLRGEEDAGRWSIVLAGRTTPARATAATLGALAAVVALIFLIVTACTALVGRDPDVGFSVGGSALYGASLVVAPAVFAALGALTSQLARTRRAATALGMIAIGVSFVIRMIADAGPATTWMRWLTPFGGAELMEPLTNDNTLPLVPPSIAVVALGAASIAIAARRDVGAGVRSSHDRGHARHVGLDSAFGLAARLDASVVAAWIIGAAASGFALGMIAKMTTSAVPESVGETLDRFGVQGAFLEQYLSVAFLLVAAVIALIPASQIGAAHDEEASGRLVNILSRGTGRAAWLTGRLTLSAITILLAALLAALGTWAGARWQGVDVDPLELVGAGLNIVPVALVVLGIGAVVLAVAPRAAAGAVYLVVAWSLIADLLSSMVSGVSWLDRSSLFHYLALAPAQRPEVSTLMCTTAVGLALVGAGVVLFARRDLSHG